MNVPKGWESVETYPYDPLPQIPVKSRVSPLDHPLTDEIIQRVLEDHGVEVHISYMTGSPKVIAIDVYTDAAGLVHYPEVDVTNWSRRKLNQWLGY